MHAYRSVVLEQTNKNLEDAPKDLRKTLSNDYRKK